MSCSLLKDQLAQSKHDELVLILLLELNPLNAFMLLPSLPPDHIVEKVNSDSFYRHDNAEIIFLLVSIALSIDWMHLRVNYNLRAIEPNQKAQFLTLYCVRDRVPQLFSESSLQHVAVTSFNFND